MPRKRIHDNSSYKLSLDLTGDNKEILDELSFKLNIKYGPLINKIINTFCRMPECIRKNIEMSCINQYTFITEEIENITGEFHIQSLEEEKKFYKDLIQLLNKGTFQILPDKINTTIEKNICLVKENIIESIYCELKLEYMDVTFSQIQNVYDGKSGLDLCVKEIEKIKSLMNAWQFVLDTIEHSLDLEYICEINKKIGEYEYKIILPPDTKRVPGNIFDEKKVESEIKVLMSSNLSWTEKAINIMLHIIKSNFFSVVNMLTAQLVANQILIKNGKGLLYIPVEKRAEFLDKLLYYQGTGDDFGIKYFLYNCCIQSIN